MSSASSAEPRAALDAAFFAADAGLGGFLRIVVGDRATVAAAFVGDGRSLTALVESDLDPPRSRDLDLRGPGLWVSAVCEQPGEHWTVGLEAFALGFDDARDAAVDEPRGEVVALGFDLEWEADGNGWRVHGEVLVADERLAVDLWGLLQPGAAAPAEVSVARAAGRFDTGDWFATTGVIPVLTPDGLVTGGVLDHAGKPVQAHPRHQASGAAECGALCRFTTADGSAGTGWLFATRR